MINLCTDEGLQDIAKYNGYEKNWDDVKKTDDSTLMTEKRFVSIKLYSTHRTKRKYPLDPMEGGHCRAGIFQANFCALLNPEDGSISDWLTYTPKDFRTATMTPNESITAEHTIGAYNSTIKKGSVNKGFFSGGSIVHVKCLSNKEVSVPKFLEACQICSEGIGRETRNSASKDFFVKLAIYAENFLLQMSDNELMNHPWLEIFDYCSPNKFPKTILNAKELSQNLNWQTDQKQIESSLQLTTFLYTEVCENYCRSPFKKDNYTNFMEKIQVPRVLGEKR